MKSFIKNKFPKLFDKAKHAAIKAGDKPIKEIFTQKYNERQWGSHESVSGPGSILESTVNLRTELPGLLMKYSIRSILDAACGDFNWLSKCNFEIEKYTGIDIVDDLITGNNVKYGSPKREFIVLDITKDFLPRADLILCRDVFVHYSFENVFKAINNFKRSNSEYMLATSFNECDINEDIFTGGWRMVNLTKSPFNFPRPIDCINDIVPGYENELKGKILGLWKLKDIKC